MRKKIVSLVALLALVHCGAAYAQFNSDTILLKGNGYVTSPDAESIILSRGKMMPPPGARKKSANLQYASIDEHNGGIADWYDKDNVISTYFHAEKAGEMELKIEAYGNSTITVSCLGKSKKVKLKGDTPAIYTIGKFKVKNPGHIKVDIQGKKGGGETSFGNVLSLIVNGNLGELAYIRKNYSTHFGRRGPSVHLSYRLPKDKTYEWFYNEVTVPADYDRASSYYMACGFGEGYFGFQNNLPGRRKVLFSVWSPFVTDNANEIPDSLRIKLLKKGETVKVQDFGGEGSGGQSFMAYDWKPGNTYKFLMRVRPDGKGSTVYTAYFCDAEDGKWRLMASFQRPKIDTWYTNPHSFLENFNPVMGYKTRRACYNNQWACTKDGEWIPVTEAVFTHCDTGRNGKRLDYTGGADENGFYLMMGGFFDGYTKGYTRFTRKNGVGEKPNIDFSTLE
jgi:hypothetical protein